MNYRREIDGLRSLAVVPVVLFHAGFTQFSGGYVGVDVFFVISGYLITGLLLADLRADRFSLIAFYERRARRILPMLFVVMAASVPFAWLWMFPRQLEEFSQSLAAVTIFLSNVIFWREEGYFAAAAELKPMLHTWSLAVEEQFYLLFPLLLALLFRLGHRWIWTVLIIFALLSLALSEWGWRNAPGGNFYLLPSRGWELLAGSLCALWLSDRTTRQNDLLAALGLILVVTSVFTFDHNTPFPSLYTLMPIAGTCFIVLFAGQNTLTGRLLSMRGPVGIGLISYSAYLWHQPLFAFARLRSPHEPSLWLMAGLSLLAFLLAALSWKFIEQPFRHRSGPNAFSRRAIFSLSGLVSAMALAVAAVGYFGQGFPNRQAPSGLTFAEVLSHAPVRGTLDCERDLWRHGLPDSLPFPGCVLTSTINPTAGRAIIVGDSHANMIALPMARALAAKGITTEIAAFSACPPFRGFDFPGLECNAANTLLHNYLTEQAFDLIVVATRPQGLYADAFDNGEGGVERPWTNYTPMFLYEDIGVPPDTPEVETAMAVMSKGLSELAQLGDQIVLVYPVPEAGWNIFEQLSKLLAFTPDAKGISLSTSYALYAERNAPILQAFDTVSSLNILRIHPDQMLCDKQLSGRCVNIFDDIVYYVDDDHLSKVGAEILTSKILQALGMTEWAIQTFGK